MIALASCSHMLDLDVDLPILKAALAELDVEAEAVPWDAPDADWAGYDLVVVRSTWDYSRRHAEFLAWADSVPALLNPAPVIRWNTDKRYLRDLSEAGVPVVPTLWNPQELPSGDGWEQFVIKPAVSAGAADTARWAAGQEEAAHTHLRTLADQGRTVMVQPYMSGVDAAGETALVFIDGDFSHASRKAAVLADGAEPWSELRKKIGPTAPTAAELAVAELALGAVPRPADLLYARVDLIPGADGEPVLLELELTEPALFLRNDPAAAARLAAAIAKRL